MKLSATLPVLILPLASPSDGAEDGNSEAVGCEESSKLCKRPSSDEDFEACRTCVMSCTDPTQGTVREKCESKVACGEAYRKCATNRDDKSCDACGEACQESGTPAVLRACLDRQSVPEGKNAAASIIPAKERVISVAAMLLVLSIGP